MRFAVWAAVSTAEQARPEKYSLDDQLTRCRQEGASRGWVESAGPFVVAGQSRTKHIQLDQASAEIEPLRLMIQAARAGRFDILLMSEFDRMRDLLDQVFRTLAAYRVQLYSLAQPIEPVPPPEYNPYKADAIVMMIGMSQILSRQEINRTRRKWFTGMPKRITEHGLPAAHIPYGYRKPPGQEHDRKAIPEPDPDLAPVLLDMLEKHLSGASSYQIAEFLQKSRVEPPKGKQWHSVTVRDILKNPFYAGIVQFGKSRVILDPETDTRKRDRHVPESDIHQGRGRHVALWDEATLRKILAEFARRTRSYRGRMNNALTGLPKCGVCGASLWRQGNGPRGEYRLIWRCSQTKSANGHINIPHVILMDKVADGLQELKFSDSALPRSPTATKKPLEPLQRKLERLESGYLAGQFELPRYTQLRADLLEQIRQAEDEHARQQAQELNQQLFLQSVNIFSHIHSVPIWLQATPPTEVNHVLKGFLEKIIVHQNRIELVVK